MSYNGIGLSTARGSGTNGYIQKNFSQAKETGFARRQKHKKDDIKAQKYVELVKDKELVKHEDKRKKIDLQVSEYRDKLEDEEEDMDDEEIDRKCEELKKQLIRKFNLAQGYKSRKSRETEEENEKEVKNVDY